MARAVFNLEIKIPLIRQDLAVKKECYAEVLHESIPMNKIYRVNNIRVNYREKEIDVILGVEADVHTCDELEKPRVELVKEVKEKIIPSLLCYLYYKHGLSFLNPHSEINIVSVLKECNGNKSAAGRELKLEASISISVSEKVKMSLPFDACDLAKFIEKSLLDNGQDEADILVRIITWYERGKAESDYVDKFIYYWIAVEAWASYHAEKEGFKDLGVGEKLRIAYRDAPICSNIPGEKTPTGKKTVYRVRCELFHFGILKDIKEAIPELEKCLEQYVIPKVMESIRNLLSKHADRINGP